MNGTASTDWNPAAYAAHARFVSNLGQPVLDLLAPRPGERILDLGCGDGALTLKIRAAGCDVVGVDASPSMVDAARALGLDAREANGESLEFDAEFDAVFSNAALHWMPRPEAVIDSVWRALRPGGRFVGEMGGHGNIAAIVQAVETALARRGLALRNPWYFPSAEEYARQLQHRGFEVSSAQLFTRPTELPGDIGGWLDAFGGPMFGELDARVGASVARDVLEILEPQLRGPDGRWTADYVRLRFVAYRPGGGTCAG